MFGENMKTIGLIPGAMKPFHAGHNYLVQSAINACDEVILWTSIKDRDNIKGKNMQKAWIQIIQPLLSKTDIRFVTSPIGAVFDYLYDDPAIENEYRIYGGAEEAARFSSASMIQRFPELTIVNVAEVHPELMIRGVGYAGKPAKGEWVRDAIQAGDHDKFRSFLPKFLKPHAKEYMRILAL